MFMIAHSVTAYAVSDDQRLRCLWQTLHEPHHR
jgi:hypothetical protein